MNKLTKDQLDALLFYMGDEDFCAAHEVNPFWSDRKAYGTLNALFFPGLAVERARQAEHRPMNPAFLEDDERLLKLCRDLLSVFRVGCEELEAQHTCRVERLANFEQLRQAGQTVAFTSTSTNGFLLDYTDKKQLVLMDFYLPAGLPRAQLERLLPAYSKAQEAEVLLPPWLPAEVTERELTERERAYQDVDGMPPVGAFEVRLEPWQFMAIKELPMERAGAEAGKRVFTAMNQGGEPCAEDVEAYCKWKDAVRKHAQCTMTGSQSCG